MYVRIVLNVCVTLSLAEPRFFPRGSVRVAPRGYVTLTRAYACASTLEAMQPAMYHYLYSRDLVLAEMLSIVGERERANRWLRSSEAKFTH